jgi:hypothetical protein
MSSFKPFTTLSNGRGLEHAIVPASNVQQWSVATAYDILVGVMSGDAAAARELTDLARTRGCTELDPDAVARYLAQEISRGHLVPIALDEWPPRGRPVLYRAEVTPDWDNLTPLSDLRERDPTLRYGWVAIQLVDHTGVPFAGYELTLVHSDGRRDRVVLDDAGRHKARAVLLPGPTIVGFPKRVALPESARGKLALDGFKPSPDDVPVPREPKSPLFLKQLDREYRLVLEPPPKHPTLSYASPLFASESALPTHAIGDLGTRAQETADQNPDARFGIFGHTDSSDDADANKKLADRRAQAVFGILTGDWDLFLSAVEQDDLDLAAHQMMLRVLGCNPTAIDGEPGDQTSLAVDAFRRAYNANTWHDEGRARAYGDLAAGDALDAPTKQALLDAYHAELSFKLSPSRFIGPKHMGCGEFNPLTDEDRDNRRVTLAIYGDDAPSDADFPCKHGDAGACQIDSGGRFTCKFYRERLRDEDVEHELTPFWDFDWLKTLSGKAHLSALTHLPDTDDAMFSVRVVEGGRQPRDDTGSGAPPSYGVTVATLPGLIRNGVAYALWSHDTNYAPFDQRRWFRVPGETDDARPWLAPYRPPVFVVASQGHWGVSEGPGLRLSRAREQGDSERPRLIVCTSGKIALVRDSASTPANSEIRTTSLLVAGSAVRVEGAK